jgi:hypothetical protein
VEDFCFQNTLEAARCTRSGKASLPSLLRPRAVLFDLRLPLPRHLSPPPRCPRLVPLPGSLSQAPPPRPLFSRRCPGPFSCAAALPPSLHASAPVPILARLRLRLSFVDSGAHPTAGARRWSEIFFRQRCGLELAGIIDRRPDLASSLAAGPSSPLHHLRKADGKNDNPKHASLAFPKRGFWNKRRSSSSPKQRLCCSCGTEQSP